MITLKISLAVAPGAPSFAQQRVGEFILNFESARTQRLPYHPRSNEIVLPVLLVAHLAQMGCELRPVPDTPRENSRFPACATKSQRRDRKCQGMSLLMPSSAERKNSALPKAGAQRRGAPKTDWPPDLSNRRYSGYRTTIKQVEGIKTSTKCQL